MGFGKRNGTRYIFDQQKGATESGVTAEQPFPWPAPFFGGAISRRQAAPEHSHGAWDIAHSSNQDRKSVV